MLGHVEKDRQLSEVPKAQRRLKTKSMADHIRNSDDRNMAIVAAYRSGNFTLAEIGKHFGLHYSTVGGIVRNYDPLAPLKLT